MFSVYHKYHYKVTEFIESRCVPYLSVVITEMIWSHESQISVAVTGSFCINTPRQEVGIIFDVDVYLFR